MKFFFRRNEFDEMKFDEMNSTKRIRRNVTYSYCGSNKRTTNDRSTDTSFEEENHKKAKEYVQFSDPIGFRSDLSEKFILLNKNYPIRLITGRIRIG